MLREETVFGPIKSRRLGNSLGINLLPTKGKICNFYCIYCECGWNKDGLADKNIPNAARVRRCLEDKLSECLLDGTRIDSITFSGDGEPTLNPEFPRIIEDTIKLRDAFCPDAKISVLSNATKVHIPEVFEALCKVDNPIMKIDAPSDKLVALINKPAPGYELVRTLEALTRFDGNFILQTMFLKSADFDSSSPAVMKGWMEIVRYLQPREIMAYTIDRPAPQEGLQAFTEAEIRELVQPLIDEGFKIQIKGKKQ